MNVQQIKDAVDSGLPVCWRNIAYRVTRDNLGQYHIVFDRNQHAIGLTWNDGVTLNGEEGDFYIPRVNQLVQNGEFKNLRLMLTGGDVMVIYRYARGQFVCIVGEVDHHVDSDKPAEVEFWQDSECDYRTASKIVFQRGIDAANYLNNLED